MSRKVSARIKGRLKEEWEKFKEQYAYPTDAEALRGLMRRVLIPRWQVERKNKAIAIVDGIIEVFKKISKGLPIDFDVEKTENVGEKLKDLVSPKGTPVGKYQVVEVHEDPAERDMIVYRYLSEEDAERRKEELEKVARGQEKDVSYEVEEMSE